MTTIIRATEVARPIPSPLRSSILDHVRRAGNLVEKSDFGLRNEAGLWPSYNCLDLLVPTPVCPEPMEDKTFDVAPWVPGFQFAVQGGVQCALLGLDRADQRAEVKRVFEATEGKGVERALLANRFIEREAAAPTTTNLAQLGEWDDPVDVTPTGETVSVVIALALLEGYAAAVYAGLPTIHMPRAAATVLEASGLIVWNGELAHTKNGSKVAMGGGYDDSTPPMAGEWDLFATGEVYVERSEQIEVQTHELNGANPDTPFDPNTSLALVERMFRVGVDCFVAKATATLWS